MAGPPALQEGSLSFPFDATLKDLAQTSPLAFLGEFDAVPAVPVPPDAENGVAFSVYGPTAGVQGL